MPDRTTVGARLYQARKRLEQELGRDVTKKEVAEAIGVHAVTYGDWERARFLPPLETLPTLGAYYGVDPAWLAWGDLPPETRGSVVPDEEAVPVPKPGAKKATGRKRAG